jgi:hypothetical protein
MRVGARAQSQKTLRIGWVSVQPRNNPTFNAFVMRLRELGYDEGRNFAPEYVQAPSATEYAGSMNEVVRRHVDIIVALGAEETLRAAMASTKTIPIVMVAIDYDPFARGYVDQPYSSYGQRYRDFLPADRIVSQAPRNRERTYPRLAIRSGVLGHRLCGSVPVLKKCWPKSWDQSVRRGYGRSTVQLRSCLGTGAGGLSSHVDPANVRDIFSGSPAG